METHDVGFIFSIVILGLFVIVVIVNVYLNGNKKKKHHSNSTPSNYSLLNANNSSQNLKTKMSKMGYNPYLNSSNSDWSYGTYRG